MQNSNNVIDTIDHGQQIRRTTYAFYYLEDGEFLDITSLLRGDVVLNPTRQLFAISLLARESYPLPTGAFQILTAVSSKEWVSREAVVCAEPGASPEEIDDLIFKGLLLSSRNDQRCIEYLRRDRQLADEQWHVYAALYHFMTGWEGVDVFDLAESRKDAVSAHETADDEDIMRSFVAEFGNPPPHFLPVLGDEKIIELPLIRREGHFYEVLEKRKTTRVFDDTSPTTLEELSCLLYYTYGCHGYVRVAEDVIAIKRTSPSGGGLHPTEVYPLVINVAGLDSGLYHYNVESHGLRLLEKLDSSAAADLAVTFTAGQQYFGSAHTLLIMTSRFYRNFWKYRKHTRAYSVLMMDAAHLSQTVYLVCAELGLGAFVTAAVNSIDIERRLGLDSFQEGCVLVSGIGRPGSPGATDGHALGGSLNPEFTPYVPRVTLQ